MKTAIQIDSVFLNFGTLQVLRGIHLAFSQDQIIGILGRNGSGKSCLLKIITGQLQPQSKHLRYGEKHLHHLYKEKGLIHYLPQHTFHPTAIRVKQLLYYYGVDLQLFVSVYPFMERYLESKFGDISGGEQRLLEVLLVLESKSKFSILDEPFSHVMPTYIDLIKERMHQLKSRKGILVTDHQYKNVMAISDRLYVLSAGILRKAEEEEDLRFLGYLTN